jgi:hypothetical protein
VAAILAVAILASLRRARRRAAARPAPSAAD